MPPKPAAGDDDDSSDSETNSSDFTSETDSDSEPAVASPRSAKSGGGSGKPPLTSTVRLGSMNDRHGKPITSLDDDALEAKMKAAQERMQGLDQHVSDLRRRAEEQDAMAKGKLPPEQARAYEKRVKELEQRRRELLQRQLGVGEELSRVSAANGTSDKHRHGGTPREVKEGQRVAMVERLKKEERANVARLAALKGGKGLDDAQAEHKRQMAKAQRIADDAARK